MYVKGRLIKFHEGLNVDNERKKQIKDDAKVFGLSN